MELVANLVGSNRLVRSTVFREGQFAVGSKAIALRNVLFDSGALHRSYISKEVVDGQGGAWDGGLIPYESVVRLADQKTEVHTSNMIQGTLSFRMDDGEELCEGLITAIVWVMPGLDFILGLPDIIRYFLDLFISMLRNGQQNLYNVNESCDEELMRWSEGISEDAPEDLETPLPCVFAPVLNFMEVSYEEARAEYFERLKVMVGEMLSGSEAIIDILKSDLAVDRFVPKAWTGIEGFPPLDLQVRDDFPDLLRVRARPINPRLYENAEKEFRRLMEYMYRESKSPWASPLVTAPKATPPFLRFCGDYRKINTYVVMPQAYIPQVQHEIEKAMGFRIFIDIDMSNAYHQLPITERSSQILAIQTPWGLVEPRFLPEGVSPGSGHLQSMMMKMFGDFKDWSIVIFDNILLLAHDEKDAADKLTKFLERAREHNVFLKPSKTWVGFPSVKFFGYVVSYGKYEMGEERKQAIKECEMPKNMKGMQSFLGAALFFKSFVPNFSDLAGPLYEMMRKTFNWDEKTWKNDYRLCFENMKEALMGSMALYFPDYELEWILRVDASDYAVGAVLYQVRVQADGTSVMEPIAFASKTFSEMRKSGLWRVCSRKFIVEDIFIRGLGVLG